MSYEGDGVAYVLYVYQILKLRRMLEALTKLHMCCWRKREVEVEEEDIYDAKVGTIGSDQLLRGNQKYKLRQGLHTKSTR